jgi:glyoxylase-like metal-dependent hydrolase (beta-lactamase superfamily II)
MNTQSMMRMALCSAVLSGAMAQAAAPRHETQVPGFFRIMVGDFEVTALNDGVLSFATTLIQHAAPGEIEKGMERNFVAKGASIPTAINTFLINTGTQLILVDTGAAKTFGPTLGFMAQNLGAAGYDPAQVDVVLLTHLHGDHANGLLTPEGRALFPNAQVRVSETEAAFWLDKAKAARAPAGLAPFFQMAAASTAPYLAAKKWLTFKPNTEVLAGITAMETGHTPGHSGFLVESKGQRLLIIGDVVHVGAVQFANPDVSVAYDLDDKPAIASRKKLFAQVARERTLLAGSHVAFPGLGHLRAEGTGYVWVPLEYAPTP